MWYDAFANEFFDDTAKITMRNVNDTDAFSSSPHLILDTLSSGGGELKTFTIGRQLVGRFWRSFGEGGCVELQFILAGRSNTTIVPRNPHIHAQIVIHEVEICTLVSNYGRPTFCKSCMDGSLNVEFIAPVLSEETGALGTLRIKSWTFTHRRNQELIPRSVLAVLQEQPAKLDNLLKNITRNGLTVPTLQYLKLCSILEPMQEMMARHKAWNGTQSPRECLRASAMHRMQSLRAATAAAAHGPGQMTPYGGQQPGLNVNRMGNSILGGGDDSIKNEAKPGGGANQSAQTGAAANSTAG